MEPTEILADGNLSVAAGAIVECRNGTSGLGVVIVEWGVKFIFEQLPNDDQMPISSNLRDGEMMSVQSDDIRCCVGYQAYIKYVWPSGQDVGWVEGKAPNGKCFARTGIGLFPKKFVTPLDIARGLPVIEVREIGDW